MDPELQQQTLWCFTCSPQWFPSGSLVSSYLPRTFQRLAEAGVSHDIVPLDQTGLKTQ